jgi:hypothetical protein
MSMIRIPISIAIIAIVLALIIGAIIGVLWMRWRINQKLKIIASFDHSVSVPSLGSLFRYLIGDSTTDAPPPEGKNNKPKEK